VRAFAGDSTMTSLPFRFGSRLTFSGGVICPWASVRPIRYILVPQTGHTPCVTGAPAALKSEIGLVISLFVLHFTQ